MRIVREGTDASPVTLYDFEPTPDRFCEDVARGLAKPQKTLPSKYFYDERGAILFEQIMELDAYYPTRTETAILQEHAGEMAQRIGPHARLVEFGSGSGEKTWILLRQMRDLAAYLPVDISRAQLIEFAMRVTETFPDLEVVPICADYTATFRLPDPEVGRRRTIAFFPGSTIGNFAPDEAAAFLGRVRTLVADDGMLLLGLDLRKDPAIIEQAYNDPEGITADFNLNLLARINRECSADFDLEGFSHIAVFDDEASRIEMRLVSEKDQTVHFCPDPDCPDDPTEVHFREGEHILTEYSHKYDLESFRELAGGAGWEMEAVWTDPKQWFAVVLLR